MATATPKRRGAAKCTGCDEIYVVEVWNDGTIRPIGIRRDCPCGDGKLRLFE